MRVHSMILVFSVLAAGPVLLGQSAPGQTDSGQITPAAPSIPTASSILRPALDQIGSGLSGVRLEKWKVPGEMREATNENLSSISRDLDGTLPSLLGTADAKPSSIADTLPVYRNVEALYDVLLRVTEVADRGAPKEQVAALHNALASLESARHALGDSVLEASVLQDAKISRLQTSLQEQKSAAVAPAPCPEVHETHHPVRKRRKEESSTPQVPPK
jgi:hypothetical protein